MIYSLSHMKRALAALHEAKGGLSGDEIAARCEMTINQAIVALRSLEDLGYVERQFFCGSITYHATRPGVDALRAENEDNAVPQPAPAAMATVCISESSLNDWWSEQDVEVKANAFLLWTLGVAREKDDEEDELEIPVEGAVPNRAVCQGDGDGTAGCAGGAMIDELHGGR